MSRSAYMEPEAPVIPTKTRAVFCCFKEGSQIVGVWKRFFSGLGIQVSSSDSKYKKNYTDPPVNRKKGLVQLC